MFYTAMKIISPLKKITPFLFYMVILSLILMHNYTTEAGGGVPVIAKMPVLSVREPAKDVGTMVEGTIIRHTFLLHNNGSLPLVIDRVDPGCSCTRVVHDPVVRPRRNSYLRVQIDTTGQSRHLDQIHCGFFQ